VAAKLDGELRAAELENLKAQLQPHFLFNTLQAISTLIHRDPPAADRMLTDLSDLLRVSLRHTAAQEVPLRDELGFLTRYLDIMRVRFGDRLTIEVGVDPGLLDAMVPSLVLQPLAENAIRHGMEDRSDAGRVEIRARREADTLILEVLDDGPGLRSGVSPGDGDGIGLANTRDRLARLYGSAYSVATRPAREPEAGTTGKQGLIVQVTIPFRTHAAGSSRG
jgi:LytS/YehU family sensor histidine kinase